MEYALRPDGVRTLETTYTSPDGLVFGRSRLRTYTYSPLDHLQVIDDVVRVDGVDQQVEPAQVDSDGWGRPRVYRVPGQPDREMEWDAEGRMLSLAVVGSEGGPSRYAYNWRDQRIRREAPGEYVESLWEGDGLLSEAVTVSGDTDVRTHLRGAGLVLATGGVRLGHDWLGSPVMLESADGGFDTRRYDAWGRIVAGDVPESGGVQVGYTGHAYDPESGLTYAQARYYDPEVGLFLGPDPWDGALGEPGTLSRFVYVGGSPLLHVDPDGRCATSTPEGAFLCAITIDATNADELEDSLEDLVKDRLEALGHPALITGVVDPHVQDLVGRADELGADDAARHIASRLAARGSNCYRSWQQPGATLASNVCCSIWRAWTSQVAWKGSMSAAA